MTFDPARPRYTLPFAGKDYELEGTFGLIEAIESALQDGIGKITFRTVEMSVSDTAKLISAALTFSGHKTTAREVGQTIVEQLGASGDGFSLLRLHLYAALKIFISPPADREEETKKMGELVGKWTAASRGETTGASASASSAGPRKRSGKQPSGT